MSNCSTSGCCNGCCPSAPDITQNITVIESDGLPTRQRRETRGEHWSVVAGTVTLLHTPISSEGVNVFVNGSKQIKGTHYTISGNVITFLVPVDPDISIEVTYLSVEDGA